MKLTPRTTTYYEVRNTKWDSGQHAVLPSPSQKTFSDEQTAQETAEQIKGFYMRMNNSAVADGMYISKITVTRPHVITRFFNEITDSLNLLFLVAAVLFGVVGSLTSIAALQVVAGVLLFNSLYAATKGTMRGSTPASSY